MNLHTAPDPDNIERLNVEPVNARRNRQPLYAPRKKVFPKRAEGRFRRFKWIVMLIALGIYYLAPWIRWDRGPYAPDQAILIDLSSRRFFFFFIEIWPQEFYYVAGLLVTAGFGLFLVTSAVGRAWCGYACPQTVWVDLFLVVERAIEGDRNARMKLDASPMSLAKLRKRVVKHSIWLLIGIVTGGAWIFYFADAPSLLVSLFSGHAPAAAYTTVAILTATTYVLGGLMREQVCTYMCPWPRIQGAMLDENSLVVTYNDWRGEQRSRHAKKALVNGLSVGDCVDCNACVAVCPMGIDIRDGQQMECITCALCIDACDGVMDKLGKPRGLIAYATLSEYSGNMSLATDEGRTAVQPSRVRNEDGTFIPAIRHFNWRIIFRPRTVFYSVAWASVGVAMLVHLTFRERLELNVVHDRNPQYVLESDGSLRNGYTLRVLNMVPTPRDVNMSLVGLEGATMRIPEFGKEDARSFTVHAEPDAATTLKVFVTRKPTGAAINEFLFVIEDTDHADRATYRAAFNAPGDIK
ncbi:cytochrome c oxidase accessory protein CcoG [Rhizobium leguminosarum]|uniref:cytochrome c oxidase accessory protein CcoG n=1 Tax=Rhizobium leguminosarum TaxID=384 RepID=UPI00103F7F55|nr:cytochrome c oxidase accessory protein CcoG [Rhizobium leguminosarum]MCA2412126.1 cytochrome c oxidase accessory protein CcoG [Rhizobium leguminosarum]TBZ34949.1 cytochrome c oxidase accessory protein CcoG [Rhizobium leguminosarum bv. viciae]TBZ73344.1 cytochrome c oxidase accessory protein CcoG [Rhizobium leguminosarum bv. viciae]TBZ80425.1 cytochrome c oxidase accessory protein CcoG [Rhizobium leguminosarum bv. viciae]TBZ81573.1 cytochrome c oxidase accessory protein CcoG [Rhizobium legum